MLELLKAPDALPAHVMQYRHRNGSAVSHAVAYPTAVLLEWLDNARHHHTRAGRIHVPNAANQNGLAVEDLQSTVTALLAIQDHILAELAHQGATGEDAERAALRVVGFLLDSGNLPEGDLRTTLAQIWGVTDHQDWIQDLADNHGWKATFSHDLETLPRHTGEPRYPYTYSGPGTVQAPVHYFHYLHHTGRETPPDWHTKLPEALIREPVAGTGFQAANPSETPYK